MTKRFIATMPTFTKGGKYVERGAVLTEDELVAKEEASDEEASAKHEPFEGFVEAPSDLADKPVVQIAAIAPSGPNPTAPQQLPPGAVQTVDGYAFNGATLVGEVTKADADRKDVLEADAGDQAKINEALAAAEAQAGADLNVSNEGTEGTVADVAARASAMDAAELDQLAKAEADREKPRKGVLDAIEARRGVLAQA